MPRSLIPPQRYGVPRYVRASSTGSPTRMAEASPVRPLRSAESRSSRGSRRQSSLAPNCRDVDHRSGSPRSTCVTCSDEASGWARSGAMSTAQWSSVTAWRSQVPAEPLESRYPSAGRHSQSRRLPGSRGFRVELIERFASALARVDQSGCPQRLTRVLRHRLPRHRQLGGELGRRGLPLRECLDEVSAGRVCERVEDVAQAWASTNARKGDARSAKARSDSAVLQPAPDVSVTRTRVPPSTSSSSTSTDPRRPK